MPFWRKRWTANDKKARPRHNNYVSEKTTLFKRLALTREREHCENSSQRKFFSRSNLITFPPRDNGLYQQLSAEFREIRSGVAGNTCTGKMASCRASCPWSKRCLYIYVKTGKKTFSGSHMWRARKGGTRRQFLSLVGRKFRSGRCVGSGTYVEDSHVYSYFDRMTTCGNYVQL